MPTPYEAAQIVSEKLVGTCTETVAGILEEAGLDPEFENNAEFCAALDDEVFECQTCGWWCFQPACTSSLGEWVCDDCASEEDEEDEDDEA